MLALVPAVAFLPLPAKSTPISFENIDTVTLALMRPPVDSRRFQRERSRVVKVKKGDTLMELLVTAGVPRAEAHAAITALRKIYNPRGLMPGHRVTLSYLSGEAGGRKALLQRVSLDDGAVRRVGVERGADNGFESFEIVKELTRRPVRVAGTISTSLYNDAAAASLPAAKLVELIHLFSWDVDFQRDVHPGDGFDVVYERFVDEAGIPVRDGAIVYAALTIRGKRKVLYRFEHADGEFEYFDESGESVRKPLMRTPVDGATLSSGFGKRKHPILGYTRVHRGVDFAASPGSRIYAAGDGVIVKRGRNGGFGRYIQIRHNAEYSTAYAHMRAFHKGLKVGSRVKQGEVIGYVGSTGASTGPHLHYEVMIKGKQVNPLALKLPPGWKLKKGDLKRFELARVAIDQEVAALAPAVQTAAMPDTPANEPSEN